MKRFLLGTTFTLLAVGCNNVEVGLLVEEVPVPNFDEEANTCEFAPGEVDFALTFDSQNMTGMTIWTEVTNVLSGGGVVINEMDPGIDLVFPNSVTPLRFDFRWECDSFGFTAGQGPLFLPAFSVTNPFCLDTRDDANGDFAGFDVVAATGPPVAPEGTAIWKFTPIPVRLGTALDDAFRLAQLSDACCRDVGGCANAGTTASDDCNALQDAFDAVAGPGVYSITNEADLNIWRPYFDYTFAGTQARGDPATVPFPLRLRGVYEGITSRGSLITSAEFVRSIGICQGGDIANLGRPCTSQITINCFGGN